MENSNTSEERALVVEDEPGVSELSQRVLAGEGYAIQTADNGQIAQGILEHEDFDLILLDIKMRRMTGIELYQWLKVKYPEKAKKVLFMTGDIMSGSTETFLQQSNLPFLLKPFTPDQLRDAVKNAKATGR